MLHSQLETSLAFKCILFLFSSFFCRDKYNWPEEIDVAGDIVVGQGTQLSEELVRKFTIIVQP